MSSRHALTAVVGVLLTVALVVPGVQPALAGDRAGLSSSHRHYRNEDRSLVRWNPCETIRYQVNVARAPRGALREVMIAMRKLSWATGIQVRYAGRSHLVPDGSYGSRAQPASPPPLVVAWAAPGEGPERSDALPARYAAFGWWHRRAWTDRYSVYHPMRILTGAVVMNTRYRNTLRPGFRSPPSRGIALMHELGHVMGLDHVRDEGQLMYPTILDHRPTWGAGDFRGLRQVGRPAGCVD
jgi:hypothetical protein